MYRHVICLVGDQPSAVHHRHPGAATGDGVSRGAKPSDGGGSVHSPPADVPAGKAGAQPEAEKPGKQCHTLVYR